MTSRILAVLAATVAAATTVMESAAMLIQGLHDKLTEALNSGDDAAVQAVLDSLAAEKDKLAQAVAANTPEQGMVQPPQGDSGIMHPDANVSGAGAVAQTVDDSAKSEDPPAGAIVETNLNQDGQVADPNAPQKLGE